MGRKRSGPAAVSSVQVRVNGSVGIACILLPIRFEPLDPPSLQQAIPLAAPEDRAAEEAGEPQGRLHQVAERKQRKPAAGRATLPLPPPAPPIRRTTADPPPPRTGP